MPLPELFHFLNFFVRPMGKKLAVLALAAGIKVFGPRNFFRSTFMGVAHLFYFTNFFRCLFKQDRVVNSSGSDMVNFYHTEGQHNKSWNNFSLM